MLQCRSDVDVIVSGVDVIVSGVDVIHVVSH